MSRENQLKGAAVMGLAESMVGAFEAGFVDTNELTIAELYKTARMYCKDQYGYESKDLSELMGSPFAAACAVQSGLEWNSPELVPDVTAGTEKPFWIAVENSHPEKGTSVLVFLAQYQNRPLMLDNNDEPLNDGDVLYSTDGTAIESVGWVETKTHIEFDSYYDPIEFSDRYKLIGWAKYTPPTFTGVTVN